jgi:hypothetical protein
MDSDWVENGLDMVLGKDIHSVIRCLMTIAATSRGCPCTSTST